MNPKAHNTQDALHLFIPAILSKKVENLVVLDMARLTSVADRFLICSGTSHRQVGAIAENVVRIMKKHGRKPISAEGLSQGHWALLDYGDVVIHVFYGPLREFYDLEGLWNDVPRLDPADYADSSLDG